MDSKIVMAICGVTSVALSVLAGIGWFAYISYPTILLTLEVSTPDEQAPLPTRLRRAATPLQLSRLQAVPFLVLAVGVDNLFIIVGWHERLLDLDNNPKAKPSAARVAETLAHAGPSMLLSTLAEEGCFFIGTRTATNRLSAFSSVVLSICNLPLSRPSPQDKSAATPQAPVKRRVGKPATRGRCAGRPSLGGLT